MGLRISQQKLIVTSLLCSLFLGTGAGIATAQRQDLYGVAPPEESLGAPLYPKAKFLRTISSLDPYYESVVYVTSDDVETVKAFFTKTLKDTRMVAFEEDNTWKWAYLLRSWIPLAAEPDREELSILDTSPNITVKRYQEDMYYPIIEYFEPRPAYAKRLEALSTAKTVIRYTYQNIPEDASFGKIIGAWRNVDRGLPAYYGCTFTFNPDSTYVFELTEKNITELSQSPLAATSYKGKTPDEVAAILRNRNPEQGRFAVLRTTISFVNANSLFDRANNSGIAEVGTSSLSLQIINHPRLTFIKSRLTDD